MKLQNRVYMSFSDQAGFEKNIFHVSNWFVPKGTAEAKETINVSS